MPNTKFKDWIKKIGIAGFLFFLIKGLVWLFIFYGLGTGIKGCGAEEDEVESHTEVIDREFKLESFGQEIVRL